jgi:predicted glycogen debranching enzyme
MNISVISMEGIPGSELGDLVRREWLETNGIGGWAGSTVAGLHTRRYHGLLVAATQPPAGRMVLLSKLDETLVLNGERFELGCNAYPGAVHPQGYQYLTTFTLDVAPTFQYRLVALRLKKTVVALHGENTVLVLYELSGPPDQDVLLELRPLVAARDYHSLTHANSGIRREIEMQGDVFRHHAYPDVPAIHILAPGASFEPGPDWYYGFVYAIEQFRGLDAQEDLFTPGILRVRLTTGNRLGVIVSTEDPAGRDAFALCDQEIGRRKDLLRLRPSANERINRLVLSADQFIVARGSRRKTVIAGYPWFTDWGRDTMIALPGLCLATGRFDDARKILLAFAESTSEGMLPNRFPDHGEEPEYNTVDATLWFFVAVYKYLLATADESFVRDRILPVLSDIVDWHQRGTRFGIHQTADGLLAAGEPGVQLTWMDAKVDDWVVTPRTGCPVEVNALWINALAIMGELSHRFGMAADAARYRKRAATAEKRFIDIFWNEAAGYLMDCVTDDIPDDSIRPNQIFALSLPFPLLPDDKAQRMLEVVESLLLTPMGLRSLAPTHPAYRPHYGGDRWSRDGAYHQGTVWSWLLGPYLTALVRVRGDRGRTEAKAIAEAFSFHLSDACIGSISEIFDADPPHEPRGCFAQAWSVGELLRAWVEDIEPEAAEPIELRA